MKLIITVCATEGYCYAMRALAQRITANLNAAKWTEPGIAIIAGDNTRACKDAVTHWKEALPDKWEVRHLVAAKDSGNSPNYKEVAQLTIAALRSAAFTEARRHNPDYTWSLDSDTLPPANALRCMIDMLGFDAGYYSVSTCPYPNEAFLGGRGTPQNPIAEDFTENERTLPDELKARIEVLKKEAETSTATSPSPEWIEKKKAVEEDVKKCPPAGNIWEIIAKHGWRKRGWLEHAYPAIGKGSIVPSDWCGFGCTLLNNEALQLANFDGYEGKGTEDLYVVWHRWHPAGLRINVIPHCPCDHVIWQKKKGGNNADYQIILSTHETQGEHVGHLRTRKVAWEPKSDK